jgi:hypothetical protein
LTEREWSVADFLLSSHYNEKICAYRTLAPFHGMVMARMAVAEVRRSKSQEFTSAGDYSYNHICAAFQKVWNRSEKQ